jgi:cyclic pyranopterin monophosphate synthase
MKNLTHTDNTGKANMVDVGHKPDQVRKATAKGFIRLAPVTIELIKDNSMKKGDVLTVAEIAGIQAGKKTSELIPLCHPLVITKIAVDTTITDHGVEVTATAICTGKTGIEMEAITSVSVALLTIYDMCKAVDKTMVIENVHLVEKSKS